MKFRYVGEAPEGFIEQYGVRFTQGGVGEVTDEWAIQKLIGNRFFEPVDGAPQSSDVPAPKRRGRPPKVQTVETDAEPGADDGRI